MNIKYLRYFAGSLVIISLAGLLLWSYTTVQKIIETDKIKTQFYNEKYGLAEAAKQDSTQPVSMPSQQYTLDSESSQYKGINLIRTLHGQADFNLTGGKVNRYTTDNEQLWTELLKTDLMQISNYDRIIENFPDDEAMHKDMNNVKQLITISNANRDLEALKYIHRILHDLDLFAFPESGKLATDFWGATHTAPSELESMKKEIEAYISDQKTEVETDTKS